MKEFMKKLSKEEMKKVVGGKMREDKCSGSCDFVWTDTNGNKHTSPGYCAWADEAQTLCYCSNGEGHCSI